MHSKIAGALAIALLPQWAAPALAAALARLIAHPAEARAMGERGRAWIRRTFSWDEIGRAMAREYDAMTDGARVRRAG